VVHAADPRTGLFIVLVSDGLTGEMDSYGPYAENLAWGRAEEIQKDLSTLEDVDGVDVSVLPLEPPDDQPG
jgi:hypothetical protein